MPEEYVADLVQAYYSEIKAGMHNLGYTVFFIHGLGRFRIRPKKFFKRKTVLQKLLDKFSYRRDNRGLMIRKELQIRFDQMNILEPEVQKIYDKRNGTVKKDLA